MYINCHTYFSYKYGTIRPEDLLAMAVDNGVDVLALTDINSTSACLDLVRRSQSLGVKLVLGIDFRNGADQLFIGLAKNPEGYRELNAYLSRYLTTEHPEIPKKAPEFEHAFVIYPFEKYTGFPLLDNEFVGVRPEHLVKVKFSDWHLKQEQLVALQTVSFRNKADFNAHRLLRAIDNNTLLSRLSKEEEGQPHYQMLPIDKLLKVYEDLPRVVKNTYWLLDHCSFDFEFGGVHRNQAVYSKSGDEQDDVARVRQLCKEGLEYRYGSQPSQQVLDRVEAELDIIHKKGFLAYFLINWDIISYARKQGYFHVGRGSGANSIIAYLLRITDVDPIELDLYFERFINLYRTNPPDFDVDFSWADRDDVTRYMFDTFDNVALVGAYVTFKYKATVRELGKVFGLPKHEIDVLSSGHFNPSKLDKMTGLILRYTTLITDFPNHCSVHASGILIAEENIHNYSATFVPPKGYHTAQFDMVVAEDAGLYKFDILSQRGLGKIKDSMEIIGQNRGEIPDIHDIKSFKNDAGINQNLRDGKAMGAFYVESPAMRMLLKKLKVNDYMGLVAASSVIRPGVAKSGMMRQYILRFRDPEKRKEAHPVLAEIMPETFGVMVYQEDVIKVAHYFAELTLAEADVLRRGMSGKFRSREEFQSVKQKYFENCKRIGHADNLAIDVWRQIESFAGYAFAKGHSASYAVESYQSLFLKTYYPLEYMVATLNNGGGFYRVEDYVHEASMLGATIHPPCVNKGTALSSIQGTDIYLGLGLLHELESNVAIQIVEERELRGEYLDFNDFIDRLPISIEQISILIRIEAFRFTGRNKRELLWEAHFKLNKEKKKFRQDALFKLPHKQFEIPKLDYSYLEDAFDQMELLGFALCHPFSLVKERPHRKILASDLHRYKDETITIWGYLIHIKKTTTSRGEAMSFGCFLDEDGYFFDATFFPKIAADYPFRGKGVYAVTGRVDEEFGFHSVEVTSARRIDTVVDPRYSDDKVLGTGSVANFLIGKT